MPKDIVFEELPDEEKKLLLRAFDYDIDDDGYILNTTGSRILSEENPGEFLHISNVALVPGTLDVIDGSPSSISKYLREKVEACGND
jgi:hypothetical protein